MRKLGLGSGLKKKKKKKEITRKGGVITKLVERRPADLNLPGSRLSWGIVLCPWERCFTPIP